MTIIPGILDASYTESKQRRRLASHVCVGDADATEDGERLQEVLIVLGERQAV